MSSMKGKVALITGGTGGIGRAAAVEFARRGASVVVTGRRQEEGERTVGLVKEQGARGLFIRADVSKEADVAETIKRTLKEFGALHYAFNNAGIEGTLGPVVEQTEAEYRRIFDINVLGVLLSMRHEIPAIISSGGGAIVNNASILGSVGMPGVSVYSASKHAVIGLTKCAALEVAKSGVRVNTLSPGPTATDMADRFVGQMAPGSEAEAARKAFEAMIPMGRIARSEELAGAAVWLCSDEASFMTGQDLLIDGGIGAA